jgi:hypothetical protein
LDLAPFGAWDLLRTPRIGRFDGRTAVRDDEVIALNVPVGGP